jgi:hypothetical protein
MLGEISMQRSSYDSDSVYSKSAIPDPVLVFLVVEGIFVAIAVYSMVNIIAASWKLPGIGGLEVLIRTIRAVWYLSILYPAIKMRRRFPTIAQGYCAFVVLSRLLFFILAVFHDRALSDTFIEIVFVGTTLWYTIWLLYFKRSVQVRAEYSHPNSDPSL